MRVLSKRTIQPKISSRSLSISKKRKGISLSNEKEDKQLKEYSSVLGFYGQRPSSKDKSIMVDRFIIYDMNRQEWERKIKQNAVQPHIKREENIQIKIIQRPNDKENQWHIDSFNPHLGLNNFSQCKRRQKNRAQQLRNRINQIQNRLNSLIVKNKA